MWDHLHPLSLPHFYQEDMVGSMPRAAGKHRPRTRSRLGEMRRRGKSRSEDLEASRSKDRPKDSDFQRCSMEESGEWEVKPAVTRAPKRGVALAWRSSAANLARRPAASCFPQRRGFRELQEFLFTHSYLLTTYS